MNPDLLRGLIFISLLLLLVVLEFIFPRRERARKRYIVAGSNCLLAALGVLSIRVLVPVTLVALADFFNSFGLLHQVSMVHWLKILISLVLLDCLIYWQHRIFHILPLFWRVHRVHHSDTSIDATTAIRFHPAEFVLSYLLKMIFLVIVGIDAIAIIIFEILLNASSLWSHSNIRVPKAVDRIIRLLFVTPDMHRVHHSIYSYEHNSNYGFCLSIWDRIFSSYTERPQDGHIGMDIGLNKFRQPSDHNLWRLLIQPFAHHHKEVPDK